MFGLVLMQQERGKERKTVVCRTQVICGMRFFIAVVEGSRSKFLEKRRMVRAAKRMMRAGVRSAAFPENFAYADVFAKCHIRAAADIYLRCAMAAKAARWALQDRGLAAGECSIALLGDHMSVQMGRALTELAIHVRYTMLNAGGGGGEICSVLRREYGVSVLRNVGPEQLQRADLIVTFGAAAPDGRKDVLWIPAGEITQAEGYHSVLEKCTYVLPPKADGQIPEECGRNAVLSMLVEAGALRPEELEVTEIVQNA